MLSTRSPLPRLCLSFVVWVACSERDGASRTQLDAASIAEDGATHSDPESATTEPEQGPAASADGADAASSNARAATSDAHAATSDGHAPASNPDAGSADAESELAPVPLSRPFRSGTRLKARYYKHEGLPDAFIGMLDTQTQEPCEFMVTAGGALYCLPRADQRKGLVSQGYLDAECKQPVFSIVSECASHDTLSVRVGRDCRGEASLHKLEPIGASVAYYRDSASSTSCLPAGTTQPDWLREGATVSPDGYVRGTPKLVASAGSLTREVIVGSDGSVDAGEIVLKAERLACVPTFTATPKPCQLFTGVHYDSSMQFFVDDTCSMKAQRDYGYSAYLTAECPTPVLAVSYSQAQDVYSARRVVKRASDGVWAMFGDCETAGSLFELGESVELPKLVGALSGSGRLRARLLKDEAGTTLGYLGRSTSLYRDVQADRDCEPVQLESGLRCMPAFVELSRGVAEPFADATCTTPLVSCAGGADCRSVVYADPTSTSCGPASFSDVFSVGVPYRGKRYLRSPFGPCVADPNPPELASAWTRVPAKLDPFAQLELVEE